METEIKLPEGAISFVIDENDNTQLSVILGDISKLLTVTYTTVVITNTGIISNVASLEGDQLDEPASSEKSYSAVKFSWGTGSGKESRGSLEVSKVDMDTQDLLINNLPTFELSYQLNGEKRIVDGLEKAAGGAIFRVGNLPYRTYTLTEIAAPNGYKLLEEPIEIIIDKEHKEIKLSVENERIKADVEARKTWVGGPSEKPDVWFKLYRNVEGGVAEAVADLDIKLIQGNDTVTWNQLPVTDTEGKTYIYSVKEVGATGNPLTLDTYFSYENGLEVINTYLIPTNATALAEKVWMGGPEEHPTIWFKLYRSVLDEDMVEVPGAEVKILEYGTTSVEWNSLEETDFNGNPYTFHVKEVDAEGLDYTPEFYEKLEDGLRVTNIHESLKRDITVEKVWVKAPEIKPTIEIQLYRNGVEYGDSVLFIDGITEHTFYGLPVEDENGDLYEYTVDEVNVPEDYSKTVDGFTITNTLERGVLDAVVKPTEPGKVLPATGSVGVLPFAYFFIALSGITYLGGKKIKKRD
ncbi:MAG: Cna B-type domain-containing protein [Erysipelothrix sp.]|nr:Cna B-type domain-containing protein [Erysipelothrix sp.]